MTTYHKIATDDKTYYVELGLKTATVVIESSNEYKIDFEVNELRVATYKSLCNDRNKISKEDFEKVKEKVK